MLIFVSVDDNSRIFKQNHIETFTRSFFEEGLKTEKRRWPSKRRLKITCKNKEILFKVRNQHLTQTIELEIANQQFCSHHHHHHHHHRQQQPSARSNR